MDRLEALEPLELAMLAVSFTDMFVSLDARDMLNVLDAREVLLLALLGRLLDAFLEYCFCAECSFSRKSLLRLLVGLTAWSLLKIC